MSKAEKEAIKRYPKIGLYDNLMKRKGFIEGYHQAEKDLALTWKDFEIIHKITYDESRNVSLNKGGDTSKKEFYQEVLNRFNKQKKMPNVSVY